MAALRQARSGFASTMGISMASGGMGKKEASEKATTARTFSACSVPASFNSQL